MENDPINQHDIPVTYLKRFSINPFDRNLRQMVYCLRLKGERLAMEKKSVNSKFFKYPDFYTVPKTDQPYALEFFFKKEIEPLFNEIMKEITQEINLSFEVRSNLMIWMYFSQKRTLKYRYHLLEEKIKNNQLKIARFDSLSRHLGFSREELIELVAKKNHIKELIDFSNMDDFQKGLGTKHWMILKASDKIKFVSNDNPGFSINYENGSPNIKTIKDLYSSNSLAYNYYPLSSKYCLLISPFYKGTPLDINFKNVKIKYLIPNNYHLRFINDCTKRTSNRYVVGSNYEQLKGYIKT